MCHLMTDNQISENFLNRGLAQMTLKLFKTVVAINLYTKDILMCVWYREAEICSIFVGVKQLDLYIGDPTVGSPWTGYFTF